MTFPTTTATNSTNPNTPRMSTQKSDWCLEGQFRYELVLRQELKTGEPVHLNFWIFSEEEQRSTINVCTHALTKRILLQRKFKLIVTTKVHFRSDSWSNLLDMGVEVPYCVLFCFLSGDEMNLLAPENQIYHPSAV